MESLRSFIHSGTEKLIPSKKVGSKRNLPFKFWKLMLDTETGHIVLEREVGSHQRQKVRHLVQNRVNSV